MSSGARLRFAWWVLVLVALGVLALPASARAQAKPVQTRDVSFEWDAEAKLLYLSVGFRDVIDPELQAKLSRGLPTTIVLTAPPSIARQSPELSRCRPPLRPARSPGTCGKSSTKSRSRARAAAWSAGARRSKVCCVAAQTCDAWSPALPSQIPVNTPLFCSAKVQVNPLSPEVVQKLASCGCCGRAAPARRVRAMRFSAPSPACFCSVGDAERELKFNSRPLLPTVVRPSKEQK